MKALAPYVLSAGLLLSPGVATARAMPESVIETSIYVETSGSQVPAQSNDLTRYSWDIARPDLAPAFLHSFLIEESTETYEPFIASEAWHEIEISMAPVRIELDDRPAAFFDERDIAGIDIYE